MQEFCKFQQLQRIETQGQDSPVVTDSPADLHVHSLHIGILEQDSWNFKYVFGLKHQSND